MKYKKLSSRRHQDLHIAIAQAHENIAKPKEKPQDESKKKRIVDDAENKQV